jgi:hypothetical protein
MFAPRLLRNTGESITPRASLRKAAAEPKQLLELSRRAMFEPPGLRRLFNVR